jgi:ERO1-like protein alpha
MKARKMVGVLMSGVWILYIVWCMYLFLYGGRTLRLEGKIDECCTDFRDINSINENINPILLSLVETNFFRRFKVDLQSKCPFWALNAICKNPKSCGVCLCDEKEIPSSWKAEDLKIFNRGKLSTSSKEFFKESTEPNNTKDWVLGEEDNPNSAYVDLIKNVESFTGYQGQNIWNTIYHHNCFAGETCTEERLLRRAISGMHTSVSTHLSEYFNDFELDVSYPNTEMYFERVGNHPERIKNLYFSFSILLRGLNLATDYLRTYNFSTGSFMEDVSTHRQVTTLLETSLKYGDIPFDESSLFKDQSKLGLKHQLKEYFHNITRIMDCVDCEKCKTYGKMQIKGLGTALKIIFDENYKQQITLNRNEIIALINTMAKWSTSIRLIQVMYDRANEVRFEGVRIASFLFFLLIVVSKFMLKAHHSVVAKFRKRISTNY